MATITSTVTVNAAFLQEIKQDNQELSRLRVDLVDIVSGPRLMRIERRQLIQLMADLRDQLAMHFSLEEAYGYFDDPISVAPRLSMQADSLRHQHAALYVEISDIAEELERLLRHSNFPLPDFQRLINRFRCFEETLSEHEEREGELISQAFDEDLGTGD